MSVERNQVAQSEGVIAGKISTEFVQLFKEHSDRGPTKCRTYIDDDLISPKQVAPVARHRGWVAG